MRWLRNTWQLVVWDLHKEIRCLRFSSGRFCYMSENYMELCWRIAQKSYLKIAEIRIYKWHIEKSDENLIFEIKSESTMKQENINTWTSVESCSSRHLSMMIVSQIILEVNSVWQIVLRFWCFVVWRNLKKLPKKDMNDKLSKGEILNTRISLQENSH